MSKRSKYPSAQTRGSAPTAEKKLTHQPGPSSSGDSSGLFLSGGVDYFSWTHLGALALVVLSMTPFTHNLDDIKVTELFILGPFLVVWGVWLIATGRLPLPGRLVGWGLGVYWIVMILSTVLSEYRWAGWHEVFFTWACFGFFFGGLAAGSSWPLLRRFCDFAVVLILVVNLFGFFQYDVFGTGRTGMSGMYAALYGGPLRGTPGAMQQLFYTFASEAKTRLMSTALNRDFYAALCLLYFPLAVSYTMITRNRLKVSVGIATALFTLISIFLCKSKGEYIFAAASAALYLALFILAVRRIEINIRYVWSWLGGVGILFFAFLWMNLPSLMSQLKDLKLSRSSREIIFAGAWGIFRDFPLFGGGPGTFKIYFPVHRRPDYFDHEISNVTELAHNYILNILSETGLAGGAAFAVFGISLAAIAFRMVFRADDNRLRLMIIAVLCGLLGMYGSNMTSTSGFWPVGAVGLWTFMGLLMGMVRQGEGWKPSPGWQKWARPIADSVRFGMTQQRLAALRWPAAGIFGVVALGALVAALVGPWKGLDYWRSAVAYNQGLLEFERITQLYSAEANNPRLDPERKARIAEILHRSEASFLRALKISPWHLSAHYKLGSVYNMLANMEYDIHEKHLVNAKEIYEKLYEFAPDYAEIHYNLGVVNYRLGQLVEQRIKSVKQTGEEVAALQAKRDEYTRLSQKFFERMKAMSEKADVYLNLGDTYLKGGQYDQAQKIFAEGMERYPAEDRFVRAFYTASLKLNDPIGQIRGLKAQWELAPVNRQYLYTALQLATEKNFAELFKEVAASALERNPVDPIVYEKIAREAQKRGEGAGLAEAADTYARLAGNADMAALLAESGGAKTDLILAGAQAAEKSGDVARARRLYGFVAGQGSPDAKSAREWLDAHPG